MMNNTEYKKRVIDHFRQKVALSIVPLSIPHNVSEDDYKLLGQIFLNVSLDGNLVAFDKRILTKQEFVDFYENTKLDRQFKH